MRDRRADERAPVLEDEDVLDLGPGEQRLGALGPEVDDLARPSTPIVASEPTWSGE